MIAAQSAPSNGDRQDRLDEPAGDDVGGPDRQQDEAPEDARVHQPGPPVLEHLRLDEGVLDQAREPPRDVAERARLHGRGRAPRRPAGGGPSRGRRTRPRPRTAGRPAGRPGRRRRPGTSVVLVGLDCGVGIADRVAAARRPWPRRPGGVVERPGERLERVVEDRDDRLERLQRGLRAARQVDDQASGRGRRRRPGSGRRSASWRGRRRASPRRGPGPRSR